MQRDLEYRQESWLALPLGSLLCCSASPSSCWLWQEQVCVRTSLSRVCQSSLGDRCFFHTLGRCPLFLGYSAENIQTVDIPAGWISMASRGGRLSCSGVRQPVLRDQILALQLPRSISGPASHYTHSRVHLWQRTPILDEGKDESSHFVPQISRDCFELTNRCGHDHEQRPIPILRVISLDWNILLTILELGHLPEENWVWREWSRPKNGHLGSSTSDENGFGPRLPHWRGDDFSYEQEQEEMDGCDEWDHRVSGIMGYEWGQWKGREWETKEEQNCRGSQESSLQSLW